MRPQSGITIEPASPAITWVTAPRRSTSTPDLTADLPGELRELAGQLVGDEALGGRRRRPRRSSRCSWLALRPCVLPSTRMDGFLSRANGSRAYER